MIINTDLHYHSSGGSLWDNLYKFLFGQKDEEKTLTKESLRILFIDDNKFPIVANLKSADYQVDWIRDIKKLDDPRVVDAHVIFVDYKGVGKNLSDKEGVGVCKLLKDKYEKTKFIVLFSGENIPNELIQEIRTASDEILRKGDDKSKYFEVINTALRTIRL